MSNVTKAYLVAATSNRSGFPLLECYEVVHQFLEVLTQNLGAATIETDDERKKIEIRGWGTFFIRHRVARPARNPRTGQVFPLPDRWVPLWRPSKEIVDAMRAAAGERGDS